MSITENTVQKWNNEFLRSMSLQTDPEAETLIKEVAISDDFASLRNLFKKLDSNDDMAGSNDLPEAVINYFNSNNDLPEWADKEKIKIAQEIFAKYGPEVSLILNYKALPLCYACRNGAKVLATTGRLGSNGEDTTKMMRRLLETAQMVVNVMMEGGLEENGAGIITVKKVRLYHAAIRYFLLNSRTNPAGWNTEYYGLPINQEEMAGTLMSFSALVINGLTQVNVELTDEQKDAYMHTWNIVGHFIGLDPKLYPVSFQDGWALGLAIIKRNQEESEDGKFLVSSLIKNSQNYFFKGHFSKHIPEYLVSFFVEDVSEAIEVNLMKTVGVDTKLNLIERFEGKLFVDIMEFANEIEDHVPFVQKIMERHSTQQMQGMIDYYLKSNNVAFYIPDSLKANWKMN